MDRTGAQGMLYHTCTMISSVDLAHDRLSCAKNWVSVDCGTINIRTLCCHYSHQKYPKN